MRGAKPRALCVVCSAAEMLGGRRLVRWLGMHHREGCLVSRRGDDVLLVEAVPLDLAASAAFRARKMPEEEAPFPRSAAKAAGVEDGCLLCHANSSRLLSV